MSKKKAYILTFTEHPEYLYAELSGASISESVIRDYVAEIVAKSNETGLDRILVYRDIHAVLSEGLVYHTVSESLNSLLGKKVALVNPHADLDREVQFGMTVAQNRGGNYESFHDIDLAREWLLK